MEAILRTDDELKAISGLLAGLEKVNVFTVPEGYFDAIEKTVLTCLHETSRPEHPIINDVVTDVPAGYFDQLPASILQKIKTLETAAAEINHLSPLLAGIQHTNLFETPAGYFDGLTGNLFQRVEQARGENDGETTSPLLSGIRHLSTFDVPADYFEQFPAEILKKIQQQPAKVVQIPKRNLLFRYAISAMMTGLLAVGLYQYIGNGSSSGNGGVPVAALDASIQIGKEMNDQQFDEAIQNLTNADIAKYLEKNGDISDATALRNNLDVSDLPTQDDYLLDETTLDNYLKEINKTTLNN